LDGGWSSAVIGSATVSIVTEDGRSCYKLVNPGNVADEARVTNTNIAWTTSLTMELVFKINDLAYVGIQGQDVEFFAVNNSDMLCSTWRGINSSYFSYPTGFISDKEANHAIQGYIDIGPTTWHTFRMVVKDSYVTVWYDGLLFYTGLGPMVAPSYGIAKWMGIYVPIGDGAHVGKSRIIYIDSIKASSTAAEPDVIAPIKIHGQNVVSRIAQKGGTGWIAQSPLRYQKTNCKYSTELTYEIPLVTTADTNASKIRIYTGSDTKSLMKMPVF